MTKVINLQDFGNLVVVIYDDGTRDLAYPTVGGLWIVKGSELDPVPTIYNPWAGYSVSGTWESHASYSAGGVDYPLAYGTDLLAPTAGTLHTSGGSGEFEAGWVGSAGRRSVLYLDTTFPRILPADPDPTEYGDILYAIVVQHQSAFGTDGAHYNLGEVMGVSGASADGDDFGGDTHLHVHGLNSSGQRVDFVKFVP